MLLPNRGMHPPQHVLSERFQLSHYACRLRLPLDHEPLVSGLPAIVREPQKVEGLRASLPDGRSALGGEPPERDQPGLALVDRQAELRQPLCQRSEELSPLRSVLTADHQVIRIPTHNDLPGCSMSPPLVYPEVDDIMEEDVRKDWADPRSLRHPHLPRFPSAALEDAGLEPPLDQAENPRVSNPVPQHPHQPSEVNGIEESSDVEIEHPVHTLRHQGLFEGRQGRVGAPSRPEAVTEAQKIGLVDVTACNHPTPGLQSSQISAHARWALGQF